MPAIAGLLRVNAKAVLLWASVPVVKMSSTIR